MQVPSAQPFLESKHMICGTWPTLYKISSTGKVQVWDISVAEGVDVVFINIDHGQQDGKIQNSQEKITEGKNLGKANETTPWEQACDQARSRWEKQLRLFYAESIEEARKKQTVNTRPMLAQKLADKAHTLTEGEKVYYQPKLDGMRCIAVCTDEGVNLISRGQLPITAVPHINKGLEGNMEPGEIWDGELYNHDMPLEEIISWCRPKKPKPGHECMEYHIFDAIAPGNFEERFLNSVEIDFAWDVICTVETKETNYREEEIEDILAEYEAKGWEGFMIRVASQPGYEHKKTKYLLKVKSFQDAEFKVIGFEEGAQGTKHEGLMSKFVLECTNKKGELDTFEGTLMGTEEKRREMWARKEEYIGELATVKFQDLTAKGIPHFAKVKAVRWAGDLEILKK